ncbi:molecular chaperone Hsp90 [uncultured Thomasclavelia sp.]|uniref:molecular chaperone Hsp90 n=1 Tax=uncultured Thomasclavelia sp. TaxID=3025759 RepID=UPI0025F746A3|nr:molecular chaperone Hsp90 [uncultured Thomasclavelia sp.]
MNKETLDYVVTKTNELLQTATCCQELKDIATEFLAALGTDQEKEMTKKYLAEIEEDIMPIDNLIAFASSEAGASVFGKDKAQEVATHAKEIKASGAKYCDCPACKVCEEILSQKEALL